MPEINGIQLLQYVKSEDALRSVPVIMMSSIDQGETVYECVNSGAEEYLVKPVTQKEVQYIWQHVLRKRSAAATVPQITGDDTIATEDNPIIIINNNNNASFNDKNKEQQNSTVDKKHLHSGERLTEKKETEDDAITTAATADVQDVPIDTKTPSHATTFSEKENKVNIDLQLVRVFLQTMKTARLHQAAQLQLHLAALDADAGAIASLKADGRTAERQCSAGESRKRGRDGDVAVIRQAEEHGDGTLLGSNTSSSLPGNQISRDKGTQDTMTNRSSEEEGHAKATTMTTAGTTMTVYEGDTTCIGNKQQQQPGNNSRDSLLQFSDPRRVAMEALYLARRGGIFAPPLSSADADAFGRDLNVLRRGARLIPEACVRAGDRSSPQEMVCCAEFDADNRHFATVSVSRSVKVFDFAGVVASPTSLHFPVWHASARTKLSSVSWNAYIRPYLITSDYDGLVQLWDASAGPGTEVSRFDGHSRRVWSLDFSKVDPLKFVSGSDDGTVQYWSIHNERAACTMHVPANVCSVKCSPTDGNLVAVGCANHRVYLFDVRWPAAPTAVVSGPHRAVSYVRFMGGDTLVASSTDNAIRVWSLRDILLTQDGLKRSMSPPPACTFMGHKNERNFVGLSVSDDGYIVTGSEDNSVHVYYKRIPFGLARYSMLDDGSHDENQKTFVSSVCWAGTSCLVANSEGVLQVLKLVSSDEA